MGKDFDVFMRDIGKYIIVALNSQEPGVCRIGAGFISDLSTSIEDKMGTYANEFIAPLI